MCTRCKRKTSTFIYLGLIFFSVAIAGILKYSIAPLLAIEATSVTTTHSNTTFINGPITSSKLFYAISDCAQRVDDWSVNNTIATSTNTTTQFTETELLGKCIGNYFVLRVSFSLAAIFLILTIITACDPLFHNGQWFTKMFIYCLFLVGSFFLPNQFFYVYSYISRIGSFLFILLQMIIMVDFAFDWHEDFLIKMEKCETEQGEANETGTQVQICCCSCGIGGVQILYLLVSFIHIVLGLVGSILLYVYYSGCPENVTIITITLLIGIIITITGPVQCKGSRQQDLGGMNNEEHDDGSIGLLVPSMVFCYCVYYAFDSVKANPNPTCHPSEYPRTTNDDTGAIVLGLIVSGYSLVWVSMRTAQNARGIIQTRRESSVESVSISKKKKNKKNKKKKNRKEHKNTNQIEQNDSDEEDASVSNANVEEGRPSTSSQNIGVMEIENPKKEISKDVQQDDHETINKKIWLFHFILSMGAFYLGMILTQWGGYTGLTDAENVSNQATSLWVNAVGGWVAYLIFIWIRSAPLICSGRDFRDATDGF